MSRRFPSFLHIVLMHTNMEVKRIMNYGHGGYCYGGYGGAGRGGSTFALIVVLFILLIIVGTAFYY